LHQDLHNQVAVALVAQMRHATAANTDLAAFNSTFYLQSG